MYIYVSNSTHFALTEEFMLFLMNEFINLNSLTCIEINTNTNYSFIASTDLTSSSETLLKFLQFLYKMDTCYFPNILLPAGRDIELVEKFYSIVDKKDSISPLLSSLVIKNDFCTPSNRK
jgi:hypothetical protein